jgi:NAD(P)-dependent dehydrogenase (short-subunit alcohol dehydrogenase family)
MSGALVWISGASGGIGRALVETVPWDGARVIGISRRPSAGAEHLEADLADPASWPAVGKSFRSELERFEGDRVVFVHAAGALEPIGYAGEVDTGAYTANVILNSAASQVLGHLFLAAASADSARSPGSPAAPAAPAADGRHLVMLTSGAATSVYEGWTSYGAGKAAIDQWVRAAGAEQETRGGVQVLAVAPGTVATAMQERLRSTTDAQFPKRQRFLDLYEAGKLSDPNEVAAAMWRLLDAGLDNGSVIDLRDLPGGR